MAKLSPVDCTIELPDALAVTGEDLAWRVLRADVLQQLDRAWLATVTLVTDVVDARVEGLLGRPAVLAWERTSLERGPQLVRGVVTRGEYLGTFDCQLHARVRIEPALALLRFTRRRRIFEACTAPELAREVLGPWFLEHEATLLTDALMRVHDERDYCVQYDETDLEFLRRVLAEAGIAFMFDPTAGIDHVRLVDHDDGFLAVGHHCRPNGLQSPPEIRVIPTQADEATEESVQSFSAGHDMTTARVTASGWDFKHRDPARVRATTTTGARAAAGEQCEHARVRLSELDRGDGPTDDATPTLSQHAAERARLEAEELAGRSNVTLLAPGSMFTLSDHPHEDFNAVTYLLTRVTHRIEIPSAAIGGDQRASSYHNEFSCMPLDRPYRPARLPAPRAFGPETAIVVGPRGEEVHTDQHGRVRVRLHWDEREPSQCHCWLRVSQAWAGIGFGALFLPRVGMEVIVSFLGGNPDRPIVTGCVYNALSVPPVALPDERTQSTIRTSSSPGGRGHNELRFEDGAGREEVYLRAQRNLREWVGSDHGTTVGRDQTLAVGRDRTTTIDGRDLIRVDGFREIQVADSHMVFTEKAFVVDAKAPSIPDGKAIEINTRHQIGIHAGEALDLTCFTTGRMSRVELRPERITLATGPELVELTPGRIRLEAPEAITLAVGGTELELRADGAFLGGTAVRLEAKQPGEPGTQLVLAPDAAVLMSNTRASISGGSARVELQDDVEIEGRHVSINGVDSAEMSGPSIVIDADTTLDLLSKAGKWVSDQVDIS